jgi:hypothetical protein
MLRQAQHEGRVLSLSKGLTLSLPKCLTLSLSKGEARVP